MVRPHRGEQILDYEREDKGLTAKGEVVRNEYEAEECVVRFATYKANPIIGSCALSAYNGNIFWDARSLEQCFELANQKFSYVGVPTIGSELVSYSWDDLAYDRQLKCWIMEA